MYAQEKSSSFALLLGGQGNTGHLEHQSWLTVAKIRRIQLNFQQIADCFLVAKTFENLGVPVRNKDGDQAPMSAPRPHSSQAALSSSRAVLPISQAALPSSQSLLSSSAPYQPLSASQGSSKDVFSRPAPPSLSRQSSAEHAGVMSSQPERRHIFPRPGPSSDVFGIRSDPVIYTPTAVSHSSSPSYHQPTLFDKADTRPVSAPETQIKRPEMDIDTQYLSLSQMLPPARKLPFPDPKPKMRTTLRVAGTKSTMRCERCQKQNWTCGGDGEKACDHCEILGVNCMYPDPGSNDGSNRKG